ncbi:membrane protein [Pedobacter antarcticus 4BY]|uniref:Membrane protein n=2 Tax=Pedobacter antarcticus TaxID=34086 RepID=A0A081PCN4_9SPHI|nr:DUF417 family protein [Pedobacter antarcticus]KEQ28457.1 membrane protein [Pedobacter antarcticus 4BY]SFF03535.1 Uncharacterized membrane protein YkgB [Pedobacter antarcticus]
MKIQKMGYAFGVIATSLVLLWIGILKFTAAEAAAIKPLVEHSFLMSWMYKIASVNIVSVLIGLFEIITGLLLLLSFRIKIAGKIGGYLALIIFLTTISFLVTTPGIWKKVEFVLVTDFFILKDLAFLAISLQVIERHSD